jgi:hypothetical protein
VLTVAGGTDASRDGTGRHPQSAIHPQARFQLLSALIMYGRIPGVGTPSWIGPVHVWSGRLAVIVSVPVAVHCLYALGFQSSDSRVLVHAVLGCLFYGVFVAKMLLLTVRRVGPFPSQVACSS